MLRISYFPQNAQDSEIAKPKGQCNLGLCYLNGRGCRQDTELAFQWIKAAAEQGHPAANYYLGNFYRDGTWVEADAHKAFECYSKAAEQGNADGIVRLGE